MNLWNKNVILGVTGGIAAYKSAQLVRDLQQAGAHVRVVMTRGATQFVGPMTFQALSGAPVVLDGYESSVSENAMPHIDLARWADIMVIAPATANTLGRVANGLADDILSTTCLAYEGLLAVAPAMNRSMWEHTTVQEHLHVLRQRGVVILGPDSGSQACGDEGPGRMLEPQAIIEALQALQSNSLLAGKKFLITAGPTREPLDPVRFITNRSSGKMGFALAETALEQGADVSLVCGPVQLQTDSRIRRIDIETALQMHEKVQELISSQDIFIACAAVADYRPAEEQPEKIKKSTEQTEIKLVRNPDIVEQARQTAPHVYTVGFAAETTELAQHAQQKLVNKGLDMIIANQVGKSAGDSGFDSDFNTVEVFWEGGQQSYSRELKKHLATLLIELIAQQYNNKKDYHSNVRYIETQTH